MENIFGNKKWRILAIVLAIILLSVIAFLGIRAYRSLDQGSGDALGAIPDDVILAVKVSDPQVLWSEKLKSTDLWALLERNNSFTRYLNAVERLDSALKSYKIELNSRSGANCWISAHPSDSGLAWLFLASSSQPATLRGLPKMLDSFKPVAEDGKLMRFDMAEGRFYYSIRKGVFMASFSRDLLIQSQEHLLRGREAPLLEAGNLRSLAGKNVDANLFLAEGSLQALFSRYFNADAEAVAAFPELSPALELDVDCDKGTLNGAGYSIPNSKGNPVLKGFRMPGRFRIDSILPASTTYMMVINPGDFNGWYKDLGVDSFALQTDPILNWVGTELAVFRMGSGRKASLAALRAEDADAAGFSMRSMLKRYSQGPGDSLYYRNYFTGRIHCPDPLASRFNGLIRSGDNPWFTLIEDYVFFSSSDQAIRQLIDEYLASAVLARNADYSAFVPNISRNSNILVYADGRNAGVQSNTLPADLFSSGLFVIQWAWDDGKYYTNASYSPRPEAVAAEGPKGWQFEMEDEIALGPFTVSTHRDPSQRVLVMDKSRNLYFLGERGQLLWKRKMSEIPFDTVTTVDMLKNGRLQYLLSSREFIYVIDANGNDVPGFPKRLRTAAMNPVAVFDYDRTLDYRLLYCGRDKKIYNLSMEATPVGGWSPFLVADSVLAPIQHFRMNENDVLALRDRQGRVYLLDRKGNVKITLKRDVRMEGPFWLDSSREKQRLGGRDVNGRQVLLSQTGDVVFPGIGEELRQTEPQYGSFTTMQLADRFPALNIQRRMAELRTAQPGRSYLISSEGRWIISYPL